MKTKKLYLNTIGCQMNVYDSEKIAAVLRPLGYDLTENTRDADVVIVNTCAIRAKAEQKAFSFLGRLAKLKKKRPRLIVGIGGCVAQQEGDKILDRMPHVDLVFGTHVIGRLPELIQRIESRRCRIVDVNMYPGVEEFDDLSDCRPASEVSRFVTIMQGCDNFCTYCVVPYVRGRETSRKPENIVREVRHLVASGVREVTLLGQNVNSYGLKEGLCSFADLLAMVNGIDGLERIRFTTSHPKDLSAALMDAFVSLDKVCRHIHLPVQSGANRILRRMNRKYTRETYLEKIEHLRRICPEIAVTSDFIVGFPGETDDEFQATLDLIRTVAYDGLFAFIYSDRPNVPAARFAEKVPADEKKARLKALLDLQEQITVAKNRQLIGSVQRVLVEGLSKKQAEGPGLPADADLQWSGRTDGNKIVNFSQAEGCAGPAGEIRAGRMVDVCIERALPHSLWGVRLQTASGAPERKGEKCYAA